MNRKGLWVFFAARRVLKSLDLQLWPFDPIIAGEQMSLFSGEQIGLRCPGVHRNLEILGVGCQGRQLEICAPLCESGRLVTVEGMWDENIV